MSDFAFDAYQDAVEQLDTEHWMSFYADGAEWLEFRHSDPPRSPNHARERGECAESPPPASHWSRRARGRR
jgi:hypothetical protein